MYTVDRLEEALALAQKSGFQIRHELLDQAGGGACRVGDKWLLYVDQTLPAAEQLSQVIGALRLRGIVQAAPPGELLAEERA